MSALSTTEQRVFDFIVADKSLKDISAELGICYQTIAVHKHNMCKKLGIHSDIGLYKHHLEQLQKA